MSNSAVRPNSPASSIQQSPPSSLIAPSTSAVSHAPTISTLQRTSTNLSTSSGNRAAPVAQTASQINLGTQPNRSTKPPRAVIEWGWWWEIGASLLSLTSLSLIIAVLAVVNNKRLDEWKLAIQPNSMIAVLTTVGKTAMMVPIASMLSQLKWSHYLQTARPLNHLQLYDDASRGPWGSFMLFYSMRSKAILAWGCAFVTIVALGIEPTAQQILAFETRPTILTNVTTHIGIAENYASKAFPYQSGTRVTLPGMTANLLPLQAAVINSVSGNMFKPTLRCESPATECEFGDFSTLAICADTKEMTQALNVSCTAQQGVGSYKCTHAYLDPFDDRNYTISIEMTYIYYFGGSQPNFQVFKSVAAGENGLATLRVTNKEVTLPGGNRTGNPLPVEVFHTRFKWCVHHFQNVIVNAALDVTIGTRSIEQFDSIISAPGEDKSSLLYPEYLMLRTGSTGRVYNVTRTIYRNFYSRVIGLFEGVVNEVVSDNQVSEASRKEFNLAIFLQDSKIPEVMQRIADGASNMIRSNAQYSSDPARNTGDNAMATMIPGQAYYNDVYTVVRWPWLILPLLEIMLAWVLLIFTMISTRKEPFLKTSVIAFSIYGLSGWTEDETDISGPESGEKLENLAAGMTASLQRNADGRLKFLRS